MNLDDILMQGTPFFHSLPKTERFVYATYMRFPNLTRKALTDKTKQLWGLKTLSTTTVDSLFAREGFRQEVEALFQAMITGPEVLAVTAKVIEVAKQKEGFQDRKLFFQLNGKLQKAQHVGDGDGIRDVTLQFPRGADNE